MCRKNINLERDTLLKFLRKGKRGRPYKGKTYYSRLELNILREERLKKIINELNHNKL
tara:strand:+ start:1187 stop:1360 length:174 start_codon:yes stop_codon:yes gene_type:complete